MKNLSIAGATLLAFVLLMVSCKGQKQEGIQTEHGFRFVNHTNKQGDKIKNGQMVSIHNDTYMGDSLIFSTRGDGGAPRPFPMPEAAQMAGQTRIPPMYDALLLMTEGDSATIYQPIDSTIEKFVPANMKGKVKDVKYVIVAVDVVTEAEVAAKTEAAKALEATLSSTITDFKAGKLDGKLAISPNKVKVLVLEAGTGAKVASGETVSTDYIGMLMNGTKFDESFSRGQTLDFVAGAGQMIPGFDEAVLSLNHGTKAVIFLPYATAYGEQGAPPTIPGKSDLAFYIDLK